MVATYASALRARARAVNVKGLKKNLRKMLLSGAEMVFRPTEDALHAGVLCFLEWLDLGVRLGSIRLNAVSSYGEPPEMRNELTSYPK